jgi:hypothetical protein
MQRRTVDSHHGTTASSSMLTPPRTYGCSRTPLLHISKHVECKTAWEQQQQWWCDDAMMHVATHHCGPLIPPLMCGWPHIAHPARQLPSSPTAIMQLPPDPQRRYEYQRAYKHVSQPLNSWRPRCGSHRVPKRTPVLATMSSRVGALFD